VEPAGRERRTGKVAATLQAAEPESARGLETSCWSPDTQHRGSGVPIGSYWGPYWRADGKVEDEASATLTPTRRQDGCRIWTRLRPQAMESELPAEAGQGALIDFLANGLQLPGAENLRLAGLCEAAARSTGGFRQCRPASTTTPAQPARRSGEPPLQRACASAPQSQSGLGRRPGDETAPQRGAAQAITFWGRLAGASSTEALFISRLADGRLPGQWAVPLLEERILFVRACARASRRADSGMRRMRQLNGQRMAWHKPLAMSSPPFLVKGS